MESQHLQGEAVVVVEVVEYPLLLGQVGVEVVQEY